MGLRVNPAEVRRWQAAGLIAPPKPARCDRPPPPAEGLGVRHRRGDDGPAWRLTLVMRGVKLVSRSNSREHWTTRSKRDRAEAAAVTLAWINAGLAGWHPPLPLTATLPRVGGRRMDDDNLAGACKAVRDRVAGLVGVDDGDGCIRWRVRQLAGSEALVRVTLAGRR